MTIQSIKIDTEHQVVVPMEILDRFPEINTSNYDHDAVCQLNAWGVELVLATAPKPEQVQQSESDRLIELAKELIKLAKHFADKAEQPAPRPAFYVDRETWRSCTHRLASCEIPVWCNDADVVLKLMDALIESKSAPRPVPPTDADLLYRTVSLTQLRAFAESVSGAKALEPVPTSERLPTEADSGPWRNVICRNRDGDWLLRNYWLVSADEHTHWQPTGLQRPSAPGTQP